MLPEVIFYQNQGIATYYFALGAILYELVMAGDLTLAVIAKDTR